MGRKYKVNHQINAEVVNLVISDGTMKGITPLSEALQIAETEGLDLVEVSSKKGKPPVCKIIDYGKMMYQLSKKNKRQIQHTKEMKFSLRISDHDLATKHRKVFNFLSKHYIVRYILELKGSRESKMVKEALGKINNDLKEFESVAAWKEPNVSSGGRRAIISTVLRPL